MTDRLDDLLESAKPVTSDDGVLARQTRQLVASAESRCRRRRSASRLGVGAALAATLGVSGVAVAATDLSLPRWMKTFNYDANRAFANDTGETCHEGLLVTPFVLDKDPTPPTPEEVKRAVAVAQEVVAEYDLSSVDGFITRDELMDVAAAIDAELRQQGLPKAYTIGAMGECAPQGAR